MKKLVTGGNSMMYPYGAFKKSGKYTNLYRFIHEDKPLLQRFLRFKQRGYKTHKKENKRKKIMKMYII